jgi:GNAT superfamily N-acetyltransferase
VTAARRCQVVRASAADLDALSQVIADALCPRAPSRWLIADPAARRAILPGYFRIYAEHAIAVGVIHTTPDRAAAAPWTGRFQAFDTALDARHLAGVAHHHLALLAVRPDRQGQGTGTALLRAHHQELDRDGIPAYLEGSDLRTRRIYLRHGYGDHGPPIQLAGGPCMYPMVRPPGPRFRDSP